MNIKEAKQLIENKYPSRKVVRGVDYDRECFIFEAPTTGKKIEYANPFFRVAKENGGISPASPMDTPDLILKFLENGVDYT